MNETLERLFWQRADGELSLDGAQELQALLGEGGGAEQGPELERTTRLLSRARLGDEAVPVELMQQVMSEVRVRSTVSSRSRLSSRNTSKRGGWVVTRSLARSGAINKESPMSRKRLALLSAAAVVVVGGMAFLVLTDNFPPGSKTSGAIGGVEKAAHYRDAQVTKEDVAVEGVGESTSVEKDVLGDASDKAIANANDKNMFANDKNLSANDKNLSANDKNLSANDKNLSANDKNLSVANDKNVILSNDKNVAANDKNIANANDKNIANANDKNIANANDKNIANAKDKNISD